MFIKNALQYFSGSTPYLHQVLHAEDHRGTGKGEVKREGEEIARENEEEQTEQKKRELAGKDGE